MLCGCYPLPSHLYCPRCQKVIWWNDYKDGFDLLPEVCLEYGGRMQGDGHNLVWQEWIAPPFPESKLLMKHSTVPSPWQKPEGMFPICWMNIRENPALSGSGFAITSRSKPHLTRKEKTGIDKFMGSTKSMVLPSFLFYLIYTSLLYTG